MQNLKEEKPKPKPVKDEYEYVSDEGELKIDEFPIRRKKNTLKREQSCKYQGIVCEGSQSSINCNLEGVSQIIREASSVLSKFSEN